MLRRIYAIRERSALTPALSPKERERRRPTLYTLPVTVSVGATVRFVSEVVRPPNGFISATRGRTIHPLLRGEGRGEGELNPLLQRDPLVQWAHDWSSVLAAE